MPEYADGTNRLSADILDRNQATIGPGPLVTCLSLDFDEILSGAGSFSAHFPANDDRLSNLQVKRHFLQFYFDGVLIFTGLYEDASTEIDDSGQMTLVVRGRDTLAELDEIPIGFLALGDVDVGEFEAPQLIINAANTFIGGGHTWILHGNPTSTSVYARFAGETALSALSKLATQLGESFRAGSLLQPGNPWTITWLARTTPSSGVRAVQGVGDTVAAESNLNLCFIQNLSERRDATRLLTRIYPYGSGFGDTRLDLAGTSRVAPAGFTLNEAENYIESDDALAYIGQPIGRFISFKEIRPLFNTDADMQTAKDYLFDAALAYLQRNDSADDVVEYDLDVLQIPLPPQSGTVEFATIKPGMTIHVDYQEYSYDLDADLVVLGVRTSIDSSSARTHKLTVSPINQWRLRETSAIVSQMEEGEILLAHPQIDANSYWENFREEIGDNQTDHLAEFPFFLSEEVVTIRQVLFRYIVDRVLVGTNSYAYASADTGQNAASNTGDTAATIDSGGAGTSGATAAGTSDSGGSGTSGATAAGSTVSGGNSTTGTRDLAVSTSGATSLNNTTVTVNDFTGNTGETGVTTDPAWPDAETAASTGGTEDPTNTPDQWVTPETHRHAVAGHTHDFAHVHIGPLHPHVMDHGHTSVSHGHTIAAEHGHAVDPNPHAHTTPDHTHTITATHTHSTPAHQHTISATHTHTTPNHTHTSPVHSHTSPQHVHAAPALVETFALTRVPALNSYVMADLEYSVNGGAWVSLDTGIPVAGGYYQADITPEIQNPNGLKRPLQEYNLVQIRRTTAAGVGKSALVRAKIGIRATIQSIVSYS